ncbi:MAG: hypothetical protein ACYDBB_07670 [Armatimonadota bacterium]
MTDEPLELFDVLKKMKRADESLTEFIAPLWPGVVMAAAWMEGKPRRYHLGSVPDTEGYYLLGTEGDHATVIRPAEADEITRYRNLLPRAKVILLDDGLAYPASFAERLQGITAPRPIHFAEGEPLEQVQARFDGLNLLFDGGQAAESNPLSGLFSGSSIFTPGEMLGVPGTEAAGGGAEDALNQLRADPDLAIRYSLSAILTSAGAELETWSRVADGFQITWRRHDETHTSVVHSAQSPIISGISLPGARTFNPATLTRFLLEHILDAWLTAS